MCDKVSNTLQNNTCIDAYLPSRKSSKENLYDMLGTAEEANTNT